MIKKRIGLALLGLQLVTGCALMSSEAAQDGSPSTATKAKHVVIINDAAFRQCPAFALEQGIIVFDDQSWRAHMKVAVVQPNKLNTWRPDLTRSTVLRYADGSKPSAGYGVKLEGSPSNRNGILTIPVRLSRPKAGMVAATVVTSPCLYLQVTGSEYTGVTVLNADNGQVLKRLAL